MSTRQIETAKRISHDHHPRWSTGFIAVDPRLCEACGDCLQVCRKGVLDMVGILFHKHVKVNHAEECRGCGKCVAACLNGAIVPCEPARAERRSFPPEDA